MCTCHNPTSLPSDQYIPEVGVCLPENTTINRPDSTSGSEHHLLLDSTSLRNGLPSIPGHLVIHLRAFGRGVVYGVEVWWTE